MLEPLFNKRNNCNKLTKYENVSSKILQIGGTMSRHAGASQPMKN